MMRLIYVESKNWIGFEYLNHCHYKIDSLSILDRNIKQFGEQNVTFVGENIPHIKLKYPKINVVHNPIKKLTGGSYGLLLALKRDISSAFVTTSCVHVGDFVIKAMSYSNCELIDEQQSSIGVYYFTVDMNRKLIKNININYHQSVSDLLKSFPDIKKVSVSGDAVHSFETSDEYLKWYRNLTDISFEELTSSNAGKLSKFYMKQPTETKKYYKPHSFKTDKLKELAKGPNRYLLALRKGAVIGYGLLQGFEFSGPPSFGILIDNQEKGTGCAFALGLMLIKKARYMGCNGIITNISVKNISSIKFCKKLGFEFKLVKNSRIYGVIDFYHKGIVIPQHYIEKTCQKQETWNR